MHIPSSLRRSTFSEPIQSCFPCTLTRSLRKASSRVRLKFHLFFALAFPFCALASTTELYATTATTGTLALYPNTTSVYVRSQQVFQAQLSTVPDGNSVSYSVDGVTDGNATTGTITNQGVYTAPAVAGNHKVTVRDNTLGTTASATVVVYSNVEVNFASRSTSLHAVPPNLFGAERMDSLHDASDLDLVKAGGFNYARFYAQIPIVFKTQTPSWNAIDATVQRFSSAGIKVMLQMYQTPPWLQPNPNPCGAGNPNAMPTSVTAWAQIVLQYVKHMDATFPGVVTDYEIWNEPNESGLCVPAASRLTDYLEIYRAAAPLMREQIRTDKQTARVGGPATAGLPATWVSAMLNDSVISQNIDFLSYHIYIFGNTQLGAEWNTYNNVMSVLQATMDSYLGPEQYYVTAAHLISTGKQPQGQNLPIYNTEYNQNWDYAQTCCQNSYTYSPVWNGLAVAGPLNAIYAGAPNTIHRLVYFAANAHPYFCLVGEIDTDMDCLYPLGSVPQPYPQYFLYQLFGASNYLALERGGYMALTVWPPELGNGLVVTAFFTSGLDATVLINPSADTLTNVPVNMDNTGFSAPSATLYRIVNGQSIQSSSISLRPLGGTTYQAVVTMGPNSVQAIAIR